jgi:hypothetical protein
MSYKRKEAMVRRVSILAVVALALISGCFISTAGKVEDYFPFANGNIWEYRNISSWTFSGLTQADTAIYISEVDGKVTLDGEDVWRVIGMDIDIDTTVDTSYTFDSPDTVKFYESLEDTTPQVWPLPPEVGKTWIASIEEVPVTKSSHFLPILGEPRIELKGLNSKGLAVDTVTAEVVAQEGVTVPAGAFADCYKVYLYSSLAEFGYYVWIAPKVGLIKLSIESSYNGTTFTFLEELTSYTLH